ncbi:AraC family transcriptional regulator [Labrenzia sp. PHM005]|uniref:AraC family transcriptional regulator n=1 Tax=Labrenzia sp. PHM005 TaxID=2590016 RepID=UPI00113FE39E|nr:AraC family transcriptional regulator [Labrenzia sp. PHM005]QDG77305.1 AraC family transcriptional regulator [Labrenzia sp. PHM005]
MNLDLIGSINAARQAAGFLSLEETVALGERGNRILDPFSILISNGVHLGEGNTIYPGCTLRAEGEAEIVIGNGNLFHSGTLIEASAGPVRIGNCNQFGEGGFTAKTNQPGSSIKIDNKGRFLNNPSVFGKTELQDGSQILGNISVISCVLGAGSSFEDPDPDLRAGLLKGSGIAKNLSVPAGHVIQGQGTFEQDQMVLQSTFHPIR